MKREYAVADESGILFATPGFGGDEIMEEIPLSGGKTLLVCGRDAERRELLEKLREAEETISAKEFFLSNMSHDMRTPMNAIMGLTVLAKKHIDEQARVSDALDKIETAGSHLLSLINNVLDMSRINSGQMRVVNEKFSVGDLLHEILVIVKPLVEQKNHVFRLDTDGVRCEAYFGDALRLRQIYVNIISNAVKYTPPGGEITVAVSDRDAGDGRRALLFRCTDNGIGMSKEFLDRIYLPFERVEDSTTSKIEGTGLGMSIVKKILDAMGGTIDIRSKQGEGTEVFVSIPLSAEADGARENRLAGKRLLVLEADEKLCGMYARTFGSLGADFVPVPEAEAAFSALADADMRGEKIDAVILGQRIDGDGDRMGIAAYLNKSRPALPLILISEDNWPEIEYRAQRCGIGHFIPLPVFPRTLEDGIAAALENVSDSGGAAYPDLSGRRILLAEDNLINREIAMEILSMTGADVSAAENGQEAVELFASEPEGTFALILMDVQMPVMNGYEAVRRIRASGKADAETVPIYAMTANTFAEDIAKAREAGMNGHIAKPIDINALMQVLQQARG